VNKRGLWYVAKFLEGAGLVLVLAGLAYSVGYGLAEEGLASMKVEMLGLAVGGGLFLAGLGLERAAKGR
jgi:hypothetical protein